MLYSLLLGLRGVGSNLAMAMTVRDEHSFFINVMSFSLSDMDISDRKLSGTNLERVEAKNPFQEQRLVK